MTDNEKRAHDLTMAMFSYAIRKDVKLHVDGIEFNDQGESVINAAKVYQALYPQILADLEKS